MSNNPYYPGPAPGGGGGYPPATGYPPAGGAPAPHAANIFGAPPPGFAAPPPAAGGPPPAAAGNIFGAPPPGLGGAPPTGGPPAAASPYGAPSAPPAAASPYGAPSAPPAAVPYGAAHHGGSPTAPKPLPGHNGKPQGPVAPSHPKLHHPLPTPEQQMPSAQQQAHTTHPTQNHGPGRDGRRRKALLIGCNYPGTRAALSGCCNDTAIMEYLLRHKFGYDNIKMLRDDGKGNGPPTRKNIMAHVRWLVGDARAGDSLFFHFSGHGSQKRDYTGDEEDGYNETLCPTDFERAGQIVDDELNEALVRPIPEGCILHCLLDACHSGTGLDLQYVAHLDPRTGHIQWGEERSRRYKGTSGGLAVQFGACKDSQTAADTSNLSGDNTSTGAATFLFVQAIEHLSKQHQALTYGNVLHDMQKQISDFNRKNGRAVDERPLNLGGLAGGRIPGFGGGGGGGGGGLVGALVGMALQEVLGGGGASRTRGQTPQMAASEPFKFDSPISM